MFVWQNLRGIHGQKCMYIELKMQCIWIIQGESLISNFKLKWVNHRDI